MDFGLSVEQQTWYDATIAFANERLAPELNLAMRDSEAEFWREGWRRCGEFGLHGLPVPTEYGGKGLGLPETIAAMEGLGYACEDNGLIFAINASLWTNTIPVLRYGTDAQKTRWLPLLSCGTVVGANGASEPEAGSDIFGLRTRATKTESGWVLNGCKTWVTAGPVADVFVCYATSDPAKGVLGISAFIVPKETAGFRVVRDIPKLGPCIGHTTHFSSSQPSARLAPAWLHASSMAKSSPSTHATSTSNGGYSTRSVPLAFTSSSFTRPTIFPSLMVINSAPSHGTCRC